MTVLDFLFQNLFALSGVVTILAANIETGETLSHVGSFPDEDIHTVSIANARLLRLKLNMANNQFHQRIEDITVSLSNEYHLIYLLPSMETIPRDYLYIVVEKKLSNLALVRHKIATLLQTITESEAETRLLEIESDYLTDKNDLRTKVRRAEKGTRSFVEEEALPFMRMEVALQLLGIDTQGVEAVSESALNV